MLQSNLICFQTTSHYSRTTTMTRRGQTTQKPRLPNLKLYVIQGRHSQSSGSFIISLLSGHNSQAPRNLRSSTPYAHQHWRKNRVFSQSKPSYYVFRSRFLFPFRFLLPPLHLPPLLLQEQLWYLEPRVFPSQQPPTVAWMNVSRRISRLPSCPPRSHRTSLPHQSLVCT